MFVPVLVQLGRAATSDHLLKSNTAQKVNTCKMQRKNEGLETRDCEQIQSLVAEK